jgi:hypothetical protein
MRLTIGMFPIWSFGDVGTDRQATARAVETAMQLYARLWEQPGPPRSTAGDLVLYSHSTGCFTTRRHFVVTYLSLLQSSDSLCNTACTIQVWVYIYSGSSWLQMVVDHDYLSTWICPLSEHRDPPLGDRCSETMQREGSKPTIHTLPHLM